MTMNAFADYEQSTQTFDGVRSNWAKRAKSLPRRSLRRVGIDLMVWVVVATICSQIGSWWLIAFAVVALGVVVHHDLLVHGHEATHRLASHNTRVNEFLLWLVHALNGLSGSAYRDIHLGHHRHTRTPGDPEAWFLAGGDVGQANSDIISALDYLKLPLVAHRKSWLWFRNGNAGPAVAHRTGIDLLGVVALHLGIGLVVGWANWLIWCVGPVVTGLAVASAIRSLCEHHGCENNHGGTRAMVAGAVLGKLWSNVDHHFEHHLLPTVPHGSLPELRQDLSPFYGSEQVMVDRGYIRTAWRLLRPEFRLTRSEPQFWVNTNSVAFKVKQAWSKDILRHVESKRRLLNLYYLGEAYEDLHPSGVFVDKLPEPWGGLLARHLADESVHAEIFTKHLGTLGHTPELLRAEDDLGWQLLNQVVPDVVAASQRPPEQQTEFTRLQTMRYLAFLHALESRSIGDLVAVESAARAIGDSDLADDIRRILIDERFHATYTLRGVYRLATDRKEAQAVLAKVLDDEQYFYNRALGPLLQGFRLTLDLPTESAISRTTKLRFGVLAIAAKLGIAAPKLALRTEPPTDICAGGLRPINPHASTKTSRMPVSKTQALAGLDVKASHQLETKGR